MNNRLTNRIPRILGCDGICAWLHPRGSGSGGTPTRSRRSPSPVHPTHATHPRSRSGPYSWTRVQGIAMLAVAAFVAMFAVSGSAQEDAGLDDRVAAFLDARDVKTCDRLLEEIVAQKPAFDAVFSRLARGRSYGGDAATGWIRFGVRGADGTSRPHLAWISEKYDPDRRYPLLVDMHGGVSRQDYVPDSYFKDLTHRCGQLAQTHDFMLLIPKGRKGAEWWNPVGARNVLGAVDHLKRMYNVDENRVFATGFSDGGSGAYYLALAHPTPFAGFIPLNGLVAVAQVAGFQVHLRNLVNRPLYVVNTGRDSLYPAAMVAPLVKAMRDAGGKVTYRVFEDVPHAPTYLGEERPRIWTWIKGVKRDPYPRTLTWETADPKTGRIHWLTVTALDAKRGPSTEFPDINPALAHPRVRLGIYIDQTFQEPGVRVDRIADASLAARLGLRKGDVIVALDGHAVADPGALRRVLQEKKPGDSLVVTVRRGEQEVRLEGAFARPQPRPAFRRQAPWASIRAVVADNVIDVTCRNVESFAVDLSPAMFDLTKPVKVMVNGRCVSEEVHPPDVRVLLENAARDQDRTQLYGARIDVPVSDPSPDRPRRQL
jgi:dienelactone hydrolase